MTQTLTLATWNALNACAAFTAGAGKKVLIMAASPHMGEALCECLRSTPVSECILLIDGENLADFTDEIDFGAGFSLVCIQPFNTCLDFLSGILRQSKLRQLIVLHSSWLGRKLLPEWNTQPGRLPSVNFWVRQIIQADRSWSYREISFGNFSSLVWGFAGGRLLALNRPDLADRCNARMRRHLFPATMRHGLAYLSLTMAARENEGLPNSLKVSGSQQKETVIS